MFQELAGLIDPPLTLLALSGEEGQPGRADHVQAVCGQKPGRARPVGARPEVVGQPGEARGVQEGHSIDGQEEELFRGGGLAVRGR